MSEVRRIGRGLAALSILFVLAGIPAFSTEPPEPSPAVLPDSQTPPAAEQPPAEAPAPVPAPVTVSVPSPGEIPLSPGDEVEVIVYRHDELTRTLHVPEDGVVFYPLVGEIQVRTMSLRQLRTLLTEKLAKFINDPQVSLETKVLKGQKIMVLGEVKSPGVFHIQEPTSAMEAITLAGGFTEDAKLQKIFLVRDGNEAQTASVTLLDMKALIHRGLTTQNPWLRGGEMLYVTTSPMEMTARFFDRVWRVVRPILFIEQGIIIYPDAKDTLHGINTHNRVVVVPSSE